jgi:hypothetical protein
MIQFADASTADGGRVSTGEAAHRFRSAQQFSAELARLAVETAPMMPKCIGIGFVVPRELEKRRPRDMGRQCLQRLLEARAVRFPVGFDLLH